MHPLCTRCKPCAPLIVRPTPCCLSTAWVIADSQSPGSVKLYFSDGPDGLAKPDLSTWLNALMSQNILMPAGAKLCGACARYSPMVDVALDVCLGDIPHVVLELNCDSRAHDGLLLQGINLSPSRICLLSLNSSTVHTTVLCCWP